MKPFGRLLARLRRFWRHETLSTASMRIAMLSLVVLAILVFVVPLLPAYDPFTQNLRDRTLAPLSMGSDGAYHLLGTDTLGRDLLSRLSRAGRISLLVSGLAVMISATLGTTLGLAAGFLGKRVENVIMGLGDLQLAIPRVLLLIAIVAVVGPSTRNLILLLGITSWVVYGRVVRAMTLSLREREFVMAASALGASRSWNIRRHVLPNVLGQAIIISSVELGQMVMLEASLSYLGLGIQPPDASWGLMINEGQKYLQSNVWLAVLPGVAILLLVGGVNILSQAFTSERELAESATGV